MDNRAGLTFVVHLTIPEEAHVLVVDIAEEVKH
jgi:hypothetical protein